MMCIIGCAPFRAGNNFFSEIGELSLSAKEMMLNKNICESAKKHGVELRIVDMPLDEKDIMKNITALLLPFENYVYQGLLISASDLQISEVRYCELSWDVVRRFKKCLNLYAINNKIRSLRIVERIVTGEQKIQIIVAFSKKDNINSYLCGNDKWMKFPYWFVTKKLEKFDPTRFDDSLEIIEAKNIEDVKNIKEIMKKGKSPCIFCSKELYIEANKYFNKTFPEYAWTYR